MIRKITFGEWEGLSYGMNLGGVVQDDTLCEVHVDGEFVGFLVQPGSQTWIWLWLGKYPNEWRVDLRCRAANREAAKERAVPLVQAWLAGIEHAKRGDAK